MTENFRRDTKTERRKGPSKEGLFAELFLRPKTVTPMKA
jgi:hypothetical protein